MFVPAEINKATVSAPVEEKQKGQRNIRKSHITLRSVASSVIYPAFLASKQIAKSELGFFFSEIAISGRFGS